MPRGLPRLFGVLAIAALVAGCGGSTTPTGGSTPTSRGEQATGTDAHFTGGTISPRRAAPALRLTSSRGRTIDIGDFRGAPVLVTFVYARCPDVCPLIMSNLSQARRIAGDVGDETRVIAVSVDPEGDTPAVVNRFLAQRGVAGFVDYLLGSRAQLEATWEAWGILSEIPKDDPELVEHSSLIYGVTASGELATAYPVGFTPAQIAADLPLLAESSPSE